MLQGYTYDKESRKFCLKFDKGLGKSWISKIIGLNREAKYAIVREFLSGEFNKSEIDNYFEYKIKDGLYEAQTLVAGLQPQRLLFAIGDGALTKINTHTKEEKLDFIEEYLRIYGALS